MIIAGIWTLIAFMVSAAAVVFVFEAFSDRDWFEATIKVITVSVAAGVALLVWSYFTRTKQSEPLATVAAQDGWYEVWTTNEEGSEQIRLPVAAWIVFRVEDRFWAEGAGVYRTYHGPDPQLGVFLGYVHGTQMESSEHEDSDDGA